MENFHGKVAIVTGTSRGIGLHIAERLAAEGAHVLGASRSAPERSLAGVDLVKADVSQPAGALEVVDAAVDRFGRLDILVNNAAIEFEGTIEETAPEDFDRVMTANVGSVFLCSKYALPALREQGGAIINIASIDGHWAEPRLAAYCASKGAVIALTRAIAIDHGPDGIRCSCICPSYVRTPMLEQYFASHGDAGEAARAAAGAAHAVGRIAEPAEVASLACWLASDEASFATGQAFIFDGGMTAGRVRSLGPSA